MTKHLSSFLFGCLGLCAGLKITAAADSRSPGKQSGAQQFIFVGGEVRVAGRVLWTNGLMLTHCIERAGGFSDTADRTKLEVRSSGSTTQFWDYNLATSVPAKNLRMSPGDVVLVPRDKIRDNVAEAAAQLGLNPNLSPPGATEHFNALRDQRKRLASLNPGMNTKEVLAVLGHPDEIRSVPEGQVLDGVRFSSTSPPHATETERWAYGPLAKGMFTKVGCVSIDRNGTVVAAMSADYFADPGVKTLPNQVPATSDHSVETPAKLSCLLGPVEVIKAAGFTPESLKTSVTLTNSGTTQFELKHDAANSIRRFLIIELCDSTDTMLFRDGEMRYHSPHTFDPSKWPVLSIAAGHEKSEELNFSPSSGFGALPPGEYSIRVYFPFDKALYHPSNRVRFVVK